jgi:hypothetical protein
MTREEFKQKWLWRGTLSRWFAVYFFGLAFIWTGAAVLLERRAYGETYQQAYENAFSGGLTAPRLFAAVAFWIVLLCVVFLWKNNRLTDDDRRFVRWWTVAAVVFEAFSLFRYILRAI